MSRTSKDRSKRDVFIHTGEDVDINGKYLGYGGLIYCGRSSKGHGKAKRQGSRYARRNINKQLRKEIENDKC